MPSKLRMTCSPFFKAGRLNVVRYQQLAGTVSGSMPLAVNTPIRVEGTVAGIQLSVSDNLTCHPSVNVMMFALA